MSNWVLNTALIFKILREKISRSLLHIKIIYQPTDSFRRSFSLCSIYKSLLKVSIFVHFYFLGLRINVFQCHLYCNINFFLCSIQQTIIHFHLISQPITSADLKILYISSTFTNITMPFTRSILQKSTIITFAIL